METLLYLELTTQLTQCDNNRVTNEVELHALCTLQQPSNTHQFLVRIGPDTLHAYFTVL